jgi:peptidoglycan/LPS O-acetylase OafA/YrhL
VPKETARSATPKPIRWAGSLVALQGGAAAVVAIVLVIRGLTGSGDQSQASGYGTALWFLSLGGAVLAGGIALILGHRWGRTIAVVAQVLLLPVAWALLTDSHQPVFGVLLGVMVVATLALLFSPPASRWMAEEYG